MYRGPAGLSTDARIGRRRPLKPHSGAGDERAWLNICWRRSGIENRAVANAHYALTLMSRPEVVVVVVVFLPNFAASASAGGRGGGSDGGCSGPVVMVVVSKTASQSTEPMQLCTVSVQHRCICYALQCPVQW